MSFRIDLAVAAACTAALLLACSDDRPRPVSVLTPPPSSGARPEGAAPPTGAGAASPAAELPPGHPPLDTAAVPAPAAEQGQGAAALKWAAPKTWAEEKPSSAMRRAQYRVSGPGGDGECVVFYFGPGQGGDPKSNAARWASQFLQTDGSLPESRMKTANFEAGGSAGLLVEVTGTYAGGMGGAAAEPKPGYMLLGAIIEGPDANWFFKFTGPEKTVRAQQAAFEQMVRGVKRGG
jgi:hypothetical protein